MTNETAVRIEQCLDALAKVYIGKRESIEKAFITVLAQGHLLIEDVPGVGKTTLGRALSHCFGGRFQHIQFTSDLLPSDILGVNIFDPSDNEFHFRQGPIFANFVLADEINRTTPKTQSALLEAMQSGRVSVDRQTWPLPQPFMVIATQNPLEVHGTFPLPLSELDRFMMRLTLGYPSPEQELTILATYRKGPEINQDPVVDLETILEWQQQVAEVSIEASLSAWMTQISHHTRSHPELAMGASPRSLLGLQRAAQARAFLMGRTYVIPDDIKSLAVDTLAHRVVPTAASTSERATTEQAAAILRDLVASLPVPR